MSRELLNKEQLEYFKNIVKGHTNLEIRELFYNKFNIKLTEQQVNNQKRRYKLKSGVKGGFEKASPKNPNYKPIGYEYITPDGYILVKVAQPSVYKFKHHIIWEQANGKIPENCYIMFLDGDRTNLSLDNLKLIKKNDLRIAISNKLIFKNKDLTETGILIAHLKREEKEKMANIWKRLNKLNKGNYEIAKETNIPEEKVEEIMEGKRPVPTEMVDNFRKALSTDNKAERSLKLVQAKQWYKETNLRKAREDLGYSSQASLSRAIGVDVSVINRFEHKEYKPSDDMLLKYYDFLNNDLNRVIEPKKKITRKRNRQRKLDTDFEIVKNWYNNFNIKEWLANKGWHNGDLAKAIGYKSSSTVCEAINLRGGFEVQRNALTRIYKYITEYEDKKEVMKSYEPKVSNISIPIKVEDIVEEPTEEDIEVLDEEITIDDKVEHIINNIEEKYKLVEEPIEPVMRTIEEKEEDKNGTIMRLEYELEEARKQIARYEKLIDMIGL